MACSAISGSIFSSDTFETSSCVFVPAKAIITELLALKHEKRLFLCRKF